MTIGLIMIPNAHVYQFVLGFVRHYIREK